MSEAEVMAQEKKARMSVVAVCSVLIPLALCIGNLSFYALLRRGIREPTLSLFSIAGFYLAALTFVLGILSIVSIAKSKGSKKGYIPAISGMIASILCLHFSLVTIGSVRPYSAIERCEYQLKEIGKGLTSYSNSYEGKYPDAERWSDLLIERYRLDEDIFRDPPSRYGAYALNPDAKPDSAADVVLVFEMESEWGKWLNQFGGPERITVETHSLPSILLRKRIRGCNVLFNDGHVEFVEAEDIDKLKWKDEGKDLTKGTR